MLKHMEMKHMERFGQRETKVRNHNSAQNNFHLLFSWYKTILLRLIEVLNHCMHDFIQLSIDCCPVKSTTVDVHQHNKQNTTELREHTVCIHSTIKYRTIHSINETLVP